MLRSAITILLAVTQAAILFGQSDGCSFSPAISVTSNCSSPTIGSSTGASQTIAGCSGNADDDVWYEFVATSSSHEITVGASANYDPVLQVFSNTCASLVSLGCTDNFGTAGDETFSYTSFTPGQVYKIRIYHWGAGSGSGNFTLCVTNPPAAPANDNCSGAIALNVNSNCTPQSYNNSGATNSLAGCSGNADDDVWFSFVATNAVQDIIVAPQGNMDLVVQLYDGTCSVLTSIACTDNTFSGSAETINAVGLTPGQTYFFRVYDYYTGTTGDFDVCVVGTPTPAPTNDEPCSGIVMPVVTSACNYATFTNVGATASSIPAPSSCVGGSGAAQGGFSTGTADVWFKIVVPSTGNINITAEPNLSGPVITDGVMALYSGTCSTLSQIACSDDHNYPGSPHDLLPMITENGLTPGDTVYLRYYGYGTSQGEFGFCVNTGLNDDCVNALYICDINGYSGSTSAAYTDTRPGNMRGNAEQNDPPNYTYTPGTNTGGIFGQGGSWGNGSPLFDVAIDNNSWISFTASDVTAVLNVSVYDCYVGGYPSGGIQMQIFDGDNCNNFIPVSNFEENSTGFTITANNLTIGNDYYLMVDGYAGDICSYTITANSGVQFPDIADVPPICLGETTTLTAPPGATSYEWTHNGATTQSVAVSPNVTTTYTCEVTGLCDYKQTLDVTVEVKPLPTISLSTGNNTAICNGESVSVTAGGATTYTWSNGATGNTINISPGSTTVYTVTGDLDGCESTEQVTVNVNDLPTLSANPSANDADCGLSNGSLTGGTVSGNPGFSFEWTDGNGNPVGNSINLSNVPGGLYTLTVTDVNSCSDDFGPFSISNPGAPPAPNLTVSNNSACEGDSVTFTATSSDPNATLTWSGPNGFNSTNSSFTLEINNNTDGNYCVVAEVSNCIGPSSCETITLNPNPELSLISSAQDTSVCANNDIVLNGSGAASLSWSGPNGFSAVGSPVSIVGGTPQDSGWYILTGVDGNGCVSEDSVSVHIVALPEANASADGNTEPTFCEGTIGELFGSGGGSYSWDGPNGFNSNNQNIAITDFSTENEGYYFLEVTDANGCQDTDSVFVESAVFNEVVVSANDTVLCPGDPLILTGNGASVYTWTGPEGFQENGSQVMIESVVIENGGTYYVTGTSIEGCSDSDSITVQVIASPDCLFIPEFFSPNLDGQNDSWVINGIDNYPEAEVFIYNRWGNLTFYASPYLNDWSGQVNKGVKVGGENGKVPSGTYFYVIKLNDDQTEPFKGYIELQY
jgi:gliding motility-associated-like protein